ncbi:MAG: hypothetical protein ACYTG7_23755 [Planctomycetota bacterium]|jgi:hypothetical protein
MESLRKSIGLAILALIGIPTLFGVVWTVGIIRAVSQPEFLPELPRRISYELPVMGDLLLEAAQHPQAIEGDNARAWIRAAAEANTTPGELMEETGLLRWLREDVSATMHDLFKVLNGEMHPEVISLDFRPLKRALSHEAIDRYFLEVVENLPPCTPKQERAWKYIGSGRRHRGGLPACRPDDDALRKVARELRCRETDLPDRLILYERDEFQIGGLDLFLLAFMCSMGLFVIPAFFIALASFVAEPLSFRAFKWSGIPTLITGAAVLITAVLPKLILKGVVMLVTWVGYHKQDETYFPSELVHTLMDRMYSLALTVLDPLLSPVISTSLFVILAGAVLYAIGLVPERQPSRPPIPEDGR